MTMLDPGAQDYLNELASRPAARAPATLSEVWRAEWDRTGLDTFFGLQKPLEDSVGELENAVGAAAGKPAQEYALDRGFNLGATSTIDQRIKMLGDLADTFDDETRKRLEPLKDARRNAATKAQKIERDAEDISNATYGLSGTATAFIAGTARQFIDPAVLAANVITAPIGGPAKQPLLTYLARQGAAGMLAQAAVEPAIESERDKLGLEAGAGRAAGNILQAGIGSAAFAGVLRLGAAGLRRAAGAFRRADTPAQAAGDLAPEDLEAAATLAERDHALNAETADRPPPTDAEHALALDARSAMEEGRPIAAEAAPIDMTPRPRRERNPDTLSLFEFLASRGGLHPTDGTVDGVGGGGLTGELGTIFGGQNRFVPGFGNLLRKGGMTLDRAREAAKEAGYLIDEGDLTGGVSTSTVNDLLGALDQEARGDRVYRQGYQPAEKIDPTQRKAEIEAQRAEIAQKFDAGMAEHQITEILGGDKKRALQIMEKEGETDALAAYERAIQERVDRVEARRNARQQQFEPIPGWDVPDDAGASPGRSGDAAQGFPERRGSGGTGDQKGSDRGGAGTPDRAQDEGAVKPIGDPSLARQAEQALAQNPDAEIHIEDPDGTIRKVKASDALKEAQEDARAVAELEDCIGTTSPQEPPF